MSEQQYDVIVLGLGGMGSAAAYRLARRGQRVLGVEQFWPAHDRGSSHGSSRIIRQAYFESPVYVPLVLRAYELWHELEQQTGTTLLRRTGGLMIGREEYEVVRGSLRSAEEWNLAHRMLGTREMRREYPQFRVTDEVALYEDAAGVLVPEECVWACQQQAVHHGAELRFGTAVTGWRPADGGVELTVGGDAVSAASLVVTAGAWTGSLLAALGLPLTPERNVVYWFEPNADRALFQPKRFPIFIWDWQEPEFPLYGFPDLDGHGAKVAFHHSGVRADPDHLDRTVRDDEVGALRARLQRCIPALDGRLVRTSTCMYTNTPDEHFAIGLHPAHPQIVVAAGFSGHGFKFAPVIGEILADLATDRQTSYPIAPFALTRFSTPGAAHASGTAAYG